MNLADFISKNRDRLIEQWRRYAIERLSLDLERSELLNDLPVFLDDLVEGLRSGGREWTHVESASRHGRHRLRVGIDIGSLTQEMNLVGVTVLEVARELRHDFRLEELQHLFLLVGRGAALSVAAYADLRDRQLADQAARHFAFIAHEIRNPLHSAQLAAQALALAPETQREPLLGRLANALDRLSDLVDDSLIQARLYGDPRLNVERLRSLELIEQAYEDLGEQAAEKNLVVEHAVGDFALEGDRTLLGSALINVLRNAIKFTCEGGRIRISARNTNGDAVFEVEDQCGGIPADLLPRLFQPFVRAGSDRSGSGLGLVIVKQAVEAHGGRVDVENHPGKGCRFRLVVPRSAATRGEGDAGARPGDSGDA